jgi:hypothetical protein
VGTDVLLEVGDHLFTMVEILDDEKDGHGEGEKTDQSKNNLKAKALIKLNPPHRIFHFPPVKREKDRGISMDTNPFVMVSNSHSKILADSYFRQNMTILPNNSLIPTCSTKSNASLSSE